MTVAIDIFQVVNSVGRASSAHATRAQAQAKADRIGSNVRVQRVQVGAGARITWHGHVKRGQVAGFAGAKIVVAFVPRAGAAAVERAFPVDAVAVIA